MSTITTKDGTQIYYKEMGKGQPILFCHGWPLSADAWDAQMVYMSQNGYRCIAHDRRSHGRSTQTGEGNHMDQYADDVAELMTQQNLTNVIMVGHSTGGGEVAHYIGRHGTSRVAAAVLACAVPPLMLKTASNPEGTPKEVFDSIRKSTYDNRAQFYKDFTPTFYGYNRPGTTLSQGICDSFWMQGMMGGLKGQLDCIHEFSEVDYTEDLKKMTVPTLVIHSEDDQVVPFAASAKKTVEICPQATLKLYKDAPHGLPQTHQDQFNADLLSFCQSLSSSTTTKSAA